MHSARTGHVTRCVPQVRCSLGLPPIMVNSCTGKMGHSAAESLVMHGFPLIPHTFSGLSVGVAVKNIGVRGVPVQLVGKAKRQAALDSLKSQYPRMMVVDFTLAHCVEDHAQFYADNGLPFIMGTTGGDRQRMREAVEAAGVYAVLPSLAGEQAAAFHALLTSLAAPLPPNFEQYAYEATGRAADAGALDLLDPSAAPEIAWTLQRMGIQCDEAQVHHMRAARQHRMEGLLHLEREPPAASKLHVLQGRGAARTCRLTAPHHGDSSISGRGAAGGAGADQPSLLLRHYGLDRAAFAAGVVLAARFLAARVAEGAAQRVYDMVDVLRAAVLESGDGGGGGGGGGGSQQEVGHSAPRFSSNILSADQLVKVTATSVAE
ncbi:hypothetical protein Agub_g12389 [Astrephomene gubernaculifera]|uniref:Dihydrodipicolinate reductase N-terminal domain-containing protein n=1 Tax=Astrephomene gubernaculifera TaxID=47775 RepID=A0AAD3HRJ2_9CHLO|nr:hypothetical protein Agub_g12389 [Astrephomene gubernaculifera]